MNILKNLILGLISTILMLGIGEFIIRHIEKNSKFVDAFMNGAPLEYSEKGYWMNPSSGHDQPLPWNKKIKYQYYPPHLRNTSINATSIPILVLGDSFTFGWLLPWEQTYVYLLQKNIEKTFSNKYQLLNAATGGWGTADHLAFLEDYGNQIKPKFVLIFLNTDDIGRSIKRDIYRLKKNNQLQNNFHPLPIISWKEKIYNSWLFKNSALIHLIHFNLHNVLSKNKHHLQTNYPLIPFSDDLAFQDQFAINYAQALFSNMNKWCKKNGAKLLVVTTGFNAFYDPKLHDPTKIFLTTASSFFKKENIEYLDLSKTFKQEVSNNKTFQIVGDQHPNDFAAVAIAKLTWPWLEKNIELVNY